MINTIKTYVNLLEQPSAVPIPPSESFSAPIDVRSQPYDLEAMIAKVQELAWTLPEQGKKFALLIGRTTDEPLPQEENVEWVSLDADLGEYSNVSRLHLQMDFNQPDLMDRIEQLFDKVVVDYAVLQFFDEEDVWRYLGRLLRPTPDAILITEDLAKSSLRWTPQEAEEQPEAANARFCKLSDKKDLDKYKVLYYSKAQDYLKSLYGEIKCVQNQPYPYAKEDKKMTLRSYFVLKNPWQSRLAMNRRYQQMRMQKGTLPND